MNTRVPPVNLIKRLSLILLVIITGYSAIAQTYTTNANGAWSSTATWLGGVVPNAANITATTVINIKHIVTYSGSNISNFGTININNNGGVSPRLVVATGVNITNNLTGRIYVINGELRQYRFAGGAESGTSQTGDFRNTGGYVAITNSFVEIARNWTNEIAGVVVVRNSSLEIGQNYDQSTLAIDTLEYSSLSIGMQGSGDYTVNGLNTYYKSFRAEVASSSGRFNLKNGIINGLIDYITLKNHVTNTYSSDKIVVNSSVVTTGLALNAYCIGGSSSYQPNGKVSGAQTADCSLSYFPAGLISMQTQTSLNFSTTPVLVSGSDLAIGALYKYESVSPGMDAIVRIDSLVGGATITKIDDNTGGLGYIEGFQPEVKAGPTTGASYAVLSVSYKITGTSNTHQMNSFSLTALDIDGSSTMKEFDEIGMGAGATVSFLNGTSDISVIQTKPGTFRGSNIAGIEKDGIDTSSVANMFTVTNTNVSVFTLKLGTAKTNTTQTSRQYGIFMRGFVYPALSTLPVKLISFTATLNQAQDKTDLKWTTASEINVSHFVIEKSYDGVNFTDAGIVFAYGNTNEKMNYSFSDNVSNIKKPLIYYRLRSMDNDNKSQLSETRIVRFGKDGDGLKLITYPNPVTNEMRVTIPSAWQGKPVVMVIYNEQGQRIKGFSVVSASQTETIMMNDLNKGFYIMNANCGNENLQQKIIKN